ncbi:MAG: hypothetical protein H0T51_07710 [Pirellulales bacterium]|nr:hypothetical protein [Pirellulales bacterium]
MKIILAILLALLAAPVAAQTMITKAAIDQGVILRIVDSVDGTPETGVVFNTAGIDLEYRRDGAASVDITEATLAALTTAHTDGGFLHIGNGYYRLDLPDAAVATGANKVLVHGTVTGMVVVGQVVQLTSFDLQDSQPDVNVNSMAGMAFGASPTVGPNFFTFFNSDDTVSGTFVHDFVDYFNTVSSINSTVGTMEPVLNDNYAVTNAIMADLFGIVNANILTIAEKLPSANAKMAGEGATAQNLDQVSGGGASQPRINFKAPKAFQLKVSDRNDGTHEATKPVRLKPGTVGNIAVSVDMSPIFGDVFVQTVGTPTVSGGSATASALGPRDTELMVQLAGTATASEVRTVTVPIVMKTGEALDVVFRIEVLAQ